MSYADEIQRWLRGSPQGLTLHDIFLATCIVPDSSREILEAKAEAGEARREEDLWFNEETP